MLLELICRRKQNSTIIGQKKHKIKQIYIWNPMTTGLIIFVNIDLCHHYSITGSENRCRSLSCKMSLALGIEERQLHNIHRLHYFNVKIQSIGTC